MEQFFYNNDEGKPFVERLAVGFPVPKQLYPAGQAGIGFHPTAGIVAYGNFRSLRQSEIRKWANGRWQLGIMSAGNHATLLHVGFKVEGLRELSIDCGFSVELYRRLSGIDVQEMVGAGLMLNAVLIDPATGLVAALRQTRLSVRMAEALRRDFDRQVVSAHRYTGEAHVAGIVDALAANPAITRDCCIAWEHSMAEA